MPWVKDGPQIVARTEESETDIHFSKNPQDNAIRCWVSITADRQDGSGAQKVRADFALAALVTKNILTAGERTALVQLLSKIRDGALTQLGFTEES